MRRDSRNTRCNNCRSISYWIYGDFVRCCFHWTLAVYRLTLYVPVDLNVFADFGMRRKFVLIFNCEEGSSGPGSGIVNRLVCHANGVINPRTGAFSATKSATGEAVDGAYNSDSHTPRPKVALTYAA